MRRSQGGPCSAWCAVFAGVGRAAARHGTCGVPSRGCLALDRCDDDRAGPGSRRPCRALRAPVDLAALLVAAWPGPSVRRDREVEQLCVVPRAAPAARCAGLAGVVRSAARHGADAGMARGSLSLDRCDDDLDGQGSPRPWREPLFRGPRQDSRMLAGLQNWKLTPFHRLLSCVAGNAEPDRISSMVAVSSAPLAIWCL